ncbi:hypothetical protein PAECIP111893_05329 [Paenibacillus plantiphilus]|uniref:Uncharacterized protein n=1 Tax=Paenibacillus plantiphilus TaxID=2905650 RepID=A0ABN8H369_9BACL|nr:hypothetical protein PAECIP111893_05329 [Paenibacillus plantiphilus]
MRRLFRFPLAMVIIGLSILWIQGAADSGRFFY